MNPTSKPLFFLVHVAKTGGNAIQHFLRSRLAPDEWMIRIEVDRPAQFRNVVAKLGGVRFVSGHLAMDEVDSYFSSFNPVRLLSLRNPIDRTISNLRFWLALDRGLLSGEFLKIRERLEKESPVQFLRSLQSSLEVHNFLDLQVRYMNTFAPPDLAMTRQHLGNAIARLDDCSSIFMAEHMFESVLMFCEKWRMRPPRSIPLVNTKNDLATKPSAARDEIREAALAACSLDIAFFPEAQKRFEADRQDMVSRVLVRANVAMEHFQSLTQRAQLKLLRDEIEVAYEQSLGATVAPSHISLSKFVDSSGFDHGLWDRQGSKIGLVAPGETSGPAVDRVLWVTDASDNRIYLGAADKTKSDVAVRIVCAMSIRSVVTARLASEGKAGADQLAMDKHRNVYLVGQLTDQSLLSARSSHIQVATEACRGMQEIDEDFKFGYASDMAPASLAIDRVDVGDLLPLKPLETTSLLGRATDLIRAGFQVQFNILDLPLSTCLEEIPWSPKWGSATVRYNCATKVKYSVSITDAFPMAPEMPLVAVIPLAGQKDWLACPAAQRDKAAQSTTEFIRLYENSPGELERIGLMIGQHQVSFPPLSA